MIEVFKTTIQEDEQAVQLKQYLLNSFPKCKINFDLEDCDKVLRVEGEEFSEAAVVELVHTFGYECQTLE